MSKFTQYEDFKEAVGDGRKCTMIIFDSFTCIKNMLRIMLNENDIE